jgi:hypothetical protein
VSAAPAPDAGLRAIEDAMLAIANLPLTKERGDDLLRVIRPALAAAPVTDAGLRTYAFRLVEAIDAKDEANIHGWTEALRAALSRQAEKETA